MKILPGFQLVRIEGVFRGVQDAILNKIPGTIFSLKDVYILSWHIGLGQHEGFLTLTIYSHIDHNYDMARESTLDKNIANLYVLDSFGFELALQAPAVTHAEYIVQVP